jgi:hypothetical protein
LRRQSKTSSAGELPRLLNFGEEDAPPPPPLGIRLLLLSLPIPCCSWCPASRILWATEKHSFSLRCLCSSGFGQGFIIAF